jgi:hypothetical protein
MLTGAMWKYPEHTTIVLMPEDEWYLIKLTLKKT